MNPKCYSVIAVTFWSAMFGVVVHYGHYGIASFLAMATLVSELRDMRDRVVR
jgi:hypothetical protein